jgi:hypothetical protein
LPKHKQAVAKRRTIIKKIALGAIALYQVFVSPIIKQIFGDSCRYSPSCSEYTKQSIREYGIIKGSVLGFRQLMTCHPFAKNV